MSNNNNNNHDNNNNETELELEDFNRLHIRSLDSDVKLTIIYSRSIISEIHLNGSKISNFSPTLSKTGSFILKNFTDHFTFCLFQMSSDENENEKDEKLTEFIRFLEKFGEENARDEILPPQQMILFLYQKNSYATREKEKEFFRNLKRFALFIPLVITTTTSKRIRNIIDDDDDNNNNNNKPISFTMVFPPKTKIDRSYHRLKTRYFMSAVQIDTFFFPDDESNHKEMTYEYTIEKDFINIEPLKFSNVYKTFRYDLKDKKMDLSGRVNRAFKRISVVDFAVVLCEIMAKYGLSDITKIMRILDDTLEVKGDEDDENDVVKGYSKEEEDDEDEKGGDDGTEEDRGEDDGTEEVIKIFDENGGKLDIKNDIFHMIKKYQLVFEDFFYLISSKFNFQEEYELKKRGYLKYFYKIKSDDGEEMDNEFKKVAAECELEYKDFCRFVGSHHHEHLDFQHIFEKFTKLEDRDLVLIMKTQKIREFHRYIQIFSQYYQVIEIIYKVLYERKKLDDIPSAIGDIGERRKKILRDCDDSFSYTNDETSIVNKLEFELKKILFKEEVLYYNDKENFINIKNFYKNCKRRIKEERAKVSYNKRMEYLSWLPICIVSIVKVILNLLGDHKYRGYIFGSSLKVVSENINVVNLVLGLSGFMNVFPLKWDYFFRPFFHPVILIIPFISNLARSIFQTKEDVFYEKGVELGLIIYSVVVIFYQTFALFMNKVFQKVIMFVYEYIIKRRKRIKRKDISFSRLKRNLYEITYFFMNILIFVIFFTFGLTMVSFISAECGFYSTLFKNPVEVKINSQTLDVYCGEYCRTYFVNNTEIFNCTKTNRLGGYEFQYCDEIFQITNIVFVSIVGFFCVLYLAIQSYILNACSLDKLDDRSPGSS